MLLDGVMKRKIETRMGAHRPGGSERMFYGLPYSTHYESTLLGSGSTIQIFLCYQ